MPYLSALAYFASFIDIGRFMYKIIHFISNCLCRVREVLNKKWVVAVFVFDLLGSPYLIYEIYGRPRRLDAESSNCQNIFINQSVKICKSAGKHYFFPINGY